MSNVDVDLLIAGSGAGGLSAAVFAAKAGFKVLLCEKDGQVGGTTATSGGIAWIPGTSLATGAGDTLDAARTYLRGETGDLYRPDLIEAFLASGAEALRELETDTDVAFDLIEWPDYHPEAAGGVHRGRSIIVRAYDARRLGADFARVRPPLRRLMVLGGLMLGSEELASFLKPFASWKNFRTVVRKVLRYGVDRLQYPRGTEVAGGNALICRLFQSFLARGGEAWTQAPLKRLLVENGRVVGAVVEKSGADITVRARKGVVLATGGFPHDPQMLRQYGADFPHTLSLASQGNTGDGIRAALAGGGAVETRLKSVALWSPCSALTHPDGSTETLIYGYLDRGRPGVIAVQRDGKRFTNESDSYHDIVMALFGASREAGEPVAYFVCDSDFIRKRGLGLIRPVPFTPSLKPYLRSGYIAAGDTIAALAKQIGVDPEGLTATVARHNEFAKTGVDLDFRKGDSSYNRLFGDPNVKPNPNLAPIVAAPFYALRIRATSLGTTIGLKADADARVLDGDERPIAGLYACGNDLASIMRGAYPGGGVTIGPAIVFAYRAVRHMAGETPQG